MSFIKKNRYIDLYVAIIFFAVAGWMIYLTRRLGFESDTNNFWYWAKRFQEEGLITVFNGKNPPDLSLLYSIWLYGFGFLIKSLSLVAAKPLSLFLFRLPNILSHLAVFGLCYYKRDFIFKGLAENHRKLLSLLILINPAVIFSASIFGNYDAVVILCCFLSFYFVLSKKFLLSAFLFGVSLSLRADVSLLFIPYIFVFSKVSKLNSTKILGALALIIAPILILSFAIFGTGASAYLIKTYNLFGFTKTFASANAFNIYPALRWNWTEISSYTFVTIVSGVLTLLLALMFVGFKRLKTLPQILELATALFMGAFLFLPEMHDRYVLLVFCLTPFIFSSSRLIAMTCALLSYDIMVNLSYVIDATFIAKDLPTGSSPLFVFSFITKFFFFLVVLIKAFQIKFPFFKDTKQESDIKWETLSKSFAAPLQLIGEQVRKWTNFQAFKITPKDKKILWLTLAVSIFLNFIYLGSSFKPKDAFTHDLPITVDFKNTTETIHGMFYFVREGEVHLEISCKNTIKPTEKDIREYSSWKYLMAPNDCKPPIRLIVKKKDNVGSIGEIFFHNKDRQKVRPSSLCQQIDPNDSSKVTCPAPETHPLFDEFEKSPRYPGYYYTTYFDEIYYARTGLETIEAKSLYEITHPPMGKHFIALSMMALGDNPFGWRTVGAIFGLIIPFIIFFMARVLRFNKKIAYIALFLCLFDPSRIIMSRISTIDIQALLWILLTYYFSFKLLVSQTEIYFQKKTTTTSAWLKTLFAIGVFWSIAISTKWISVYSLSCLFPVIAVSLILIFLNGQDKSSKQILKIVSISALIFLVMPTLIYFASYLPYMLDPRRVFTWKNVLENQKYMFSYHADLTAQHPFASRYFSWPFIGRPLWLYMQDGLPPGTTGSLALLGNPLVVWSIIPTIFCCFYFRKWFWHLGTMLLLLGIAAQFLPWTLINRVTFYYHFLPSTTLAFILIGLLLERLCTVNKRLFWIYISLSSIIFLEFLPIIYGFTVPSSYINRFLKWFDVWIF